MNNEKALRNIFTIICSGYVDTLITGIEEHPQDFPYTIASANFISELEEQNIIVNTNTIFGSCVRDMIHR